MGPNGDTEPFPSVSAGGATPSTSDPKPAIVRSGTSSSSISGRLRRASESFGQSELPGGFMAATGGIASSILSRQTRSASQDRSAEGDSTQPIAMTDVPRRTSTIRSIQEEVHRDNLDASSSANDAKDNGEPATVAPFDNGYHFPPSHTFSQSFTTGMRASWAYILTPVGFCVTIYGLNVVAWGGMLFLLLCNAAPAMCHPTCNDINSPRRKWIEWDSQILNALFCVTGFGLAPWRFRDLYFLLQYRLQKKEVALRRLGAIHRGWFRLPGSYELPDDLGPKNVADFPDASTSLAIPSPASMIPEVPLTGKRASQTAIWKMDAVIWLMVWNTFFQCCLAGFMWGLNRYDRPSWSTGLFVALACIVAAVGGLFMFLEGKRVKSIEGVPVSEEDLRQLQEDREKGVYHYNNIKDKDLTPDQKGKKKAPQAGAD